MLDLGYYGWQRAEVRAIPVIAARTCWIREFGAPHGVRPTGPSDIRRIEGGILDWGADRAYEDNPFEIGLERLVDFGLADDACLSIAALRRIRAEGVRRRLVGVELDGDPFPELNNVKWPARPRAGGSTIGKVTSAIYSPRLRRNLGYCWVPAELAAPGSSLAVDSEWGERVATVVPMPFVDPDKRIPVS